MTRVSTFSTFLLALIVVTNGASNNRPQAPVQSQAANPNVSTLPTETIAAATLPDHKISFEQARFSPDGQILAIVTNDSITSPNCPCEVWLYDMRSHQSVPAILPGLLNTRISEDTPSYISAHGLRDAVVIVPNDYFGFRLTWASDDTLYVEAGSQALGDASNTKVVATMAGAKEIDEYPSEVTSAFRAFLQEHHFLTPPTKPCTSLAGRNDQFVVTLEGSPTAPNCRGAAQLMAAWSDGTHVQNITDIDYSAFDGVFFDAESSLVLYRNPGELSAGAIVAFDLKTGQRQTLALPYDFQLQFLDRAKNGMLAYSVSGPCVPDDSVEHIPHLCFVKFP